MKIAFDLDILNERGTTVAALDYAKYGQQFSGIEPVFLYGSIDSERPVEALARVSQTFETIKYASRSNIGPLVKGIKADVYYKLITQPDVSDRIPGVLNASHAVFDFDRPFGDVWAYISKWLAQHTSGDRYPSVPHIVDMPPPDGTLRKSLNIPEDALVLGRYGGLLQFDVPLVHRAILDVVERRKDIYFLFANTQTFGTHKRILYLPTMYSPEEKARFIATCDWMLHGRYRGESFGLSMAEFLALDCPVMCWAGGWERNHIEMQPNKEFIYTSYGSLCRMLMSADREHRPVNVRTAIQDFSPDNVWRRWRDTFLQATNRVPLAPIPKYLRYQRKAKNRLRKAASSLYSL